MVGGSDQSNQGYYDRQKVKPSYHRIKKAVKQAACPKLASFEAYQDCGYRKMAKTCSNPDLIATCPVPQLDMKKGVLNQMAFSLFFFLGTFAGGISTGLLRTSSGTGIYRKGN